jgi:hypothetical protein
MTGRARFVLGLALPLAVLATGAWAHVRLRNSGNGYELHWGLPASIPITINVTGTSNVPGSGHFPALQNAIRTWNEAPGSKARLVEVTSASERARTDWWSDDVHLVMFDEVNASGYFPIGTGIVAITPVWFTNSGAISDADVLFNGRDFDFTTSGVPLRFDIQDVATHELGHLLGLDHSGWAGATMYPYVDPTVILHRSLSQDDVCGLRDAYPSTPFGSISGVIRRADDSFVAGAHVVARDGNGRPYASDLATMFGAFRIHGLPPGSYSLHASPLDQPVSGANLTSNHTVHTDFQSTPLGTVVVPDVEDVAIGSRTVYGDAALSLGRSSDVFPVRCVSGATRVVTIRGSALSSTCTLSASDPSIVLGAPAWGASMVQVPVTVPAGTPSGHFDLTVTNAAGDRATLVSGLEITPPDPVITSVTPGSASVHGGTELEITGANFRPGSRVVIGLWTYVDGVSCTVESASTIRLVTAETQVGPCHVVVMDGSGIEGRAANAVTFGAQPAIESVFPLAGSAAGGTPLVLRGVDFLEGCTVTIDGVVQTSIVSATESRIEIDTGPGVPGGPYTVEIRNPGGETATSLFSYAAAPDPVVTLLEPAGGSRDGGESVIVRGANFTASTVVRFGVNADTGAGGVLAQEVELVDAFTLRVVTPATDGGPSNVIVLDEATGQAAVLPSGFTFESSGGGGGCSLGTFAPSEPPSRGASGWLAVACAFAWLVFRAERSKRVAT